jgi:hypothetical protein
MGLCHCAIHSLHLVTLPEVALMTSLAFHFVGTRKNANTLAGLYQLELLFTK